MLKPVEVIRRREIAAGASGPGDIDELHLEVSSSLASVRSRLVDTADTCYGKLLDELLKVDEYKMIADAWSAREKRKEICQFWHRLDGEWSFPLLDAPFKPQIQVSRLSQLLIECRRSQPGRTRSPRSTRSGTWIRRSCSRRSVMAPSGS